MPAQAELRITLAESLNDFINEQIAQGRYRDAGAYISSLVTAARKARARKHLKALLEEAEHSGPSTPCTQSDWENLHKRVENRLQKPHRDSSR